VDVGVMPLAALDGRLWKYAGGGGVGIITGL
jgi:hypothetical protein